MTERAKHTFTVKEYGDGKPWIMLELFDGDELSALQNGFLGFDLREGTTISEAQEIANMLNSNVRNTTFTDLSSE